LTLLESHWIKEKTTLRKLVKLLLPVVAFALLAPAAMAQFGNMPPEVQAKMRAWQKFRETHKNFEYLQQTLAGINEMEKYPTTRLTKDQAKQILAVIKPWRNRPVMTNEQAGQVNKALNKPLTLDQVKKVATAPNMMRGGRGFGGRAGGGGGGGAGGGGQRRPGQFDFSKFPDPKEYNPLNPASLPFEQFRPMATQRMNELMKLLEDRAR
jgi:uncharacterized membrane protein YgcG